MKKQQLNTEVSNDLLAAREEWQEAKHDKKASKAMRNKRKNGKRTQWQEAV